jgi:DNA-3-methyladenine glycosylase
MSTRPDEMPRTRPKRLPRTFYGRPTLDVAPELLGKYVVYNSPQGRMSARIVEVEAYVGRDDPACHAAPGPTRRNAVMFGRPGVSYIYFIYGMYYCLNFVTEPEGQPAAVLLRAAEPDEGFDIMQYHSPRLNERRILSGPGKFCRAFGLSVEQSGLDLIERVLYLEDRGGPRPEIAKATRVGIRKAAERPWRFYDANSSSISKL